MKSAEPAQISIIVPCYNEAENVSRFYGAISAAIPERAWEIIFVDDNSPDNTAQRVTDIAREDRRVRLVRRVGRRGLSSAVIEGVLASTAPLLVVMDGDMQHDERVLPSMLDPLDANECDVVVASRHIEGGDSAGLAHKGRHALSQTGIRLAQLLMQHQLNDPMSGYFAFRRAVFEQALPRMRGTGFKILLEMLLSLPRSMRVLEVPFVFRPRHAGESKLGALVLLQFAGMLLERALGGLLPMRFIVFALIGAVGIAVNLGVSELTRAIGFDFRQSQTLGMLAAVLVNFVLNNELTYHEKRLRGALRISIGFSVFLVGCSLGAYANIGVAEMLYHADQRWSEASAAGALIGVVWNFAIASTLVWR